MKEMYLTVECSFFVRQVLVLLEDEVEMDG